MKECCETCKAFDGYYGCLMFHVITYKSDYCTAYTPKNKSSRENVSEEKEDE